MIREQFSQGEGSTLRIVLDAARFLDSGTPEVNTGLS
jgi:hypothetical protein